MISSKDFPEPVIDFTPEAQDILDYAEGIETNLPSGINGRDLLQKLGVCAKMDRWKIYQVLQGALENFSDAWNAIIDDETAVTLNLDDLSDVETMTDAKQDKIVEEHFAFLNRRIATVCHLAIEYLRPDMLK